MGGRPGWPGGEATWLGKETETIYWGLVLIRIKSDCGLLRRLGRDGWAAEFDFSGFTWVLIFWVYLFELLICLHYFCDSARGHG